MSTLAPLRSWRCSPPFSPSTDDIYAREGLTLEEEDVKAEVQARIQQYKVGGRMGVGDVWDACV
jgi:hypothetical protein